MAIVPNLNAGCLNKCSCNFLFVARVGLCCDFAVVIFCLLQGSAFVVDFGTVFCIRFETLRLMATAVSFLVPFA